MYKIVVVMILPILMFMAGCGSSGYIAEDQADGQHIYVHNDPMDNWYTLQQMQRQSTQDFIDQTNKTMDSMDRSIRHMGRDNRDTLGILENARMQDELYRQQQRENMRRAYGR
jgi:hypothetical protein